MIAIGFLVFLFGFLVIGMLSARVSKGHANDYLIADKAVKPWLVGLSAVATNNSGYMFIGMIGYTYSVGLQTIWLMIGWIVGDLCANLMAVKEMRRAADRDNIHSFGGLLAHWYGQNHTALRRLVGLVTVFFLTIYAAAQLKAGSKAVFALLDWDLWVGIIVGAVIILCYSWAGGIRASIWTDAAQSFVMILGMFLLMFCGYSLVSANDSVGEQLNAIDPHYMDLFPAGTWWSAFLFVLGWVGGGMAIIGQPHIAIRFMSIDSEKSINKMRIWYYAWFTFFYGATIVVGLLARLILPDTASFDSEVALPLMAEELLSPFFIGLILAALFAATMSTADSQILSCSAAITRDFKQSDKHSLIAAKITTISVLSIASLLAIWNNDKVFAMVLDAWGMLGAAFAPLIIALALGYRCPQSISIAGIIIGIGTFMFYKLGLPYFEIEWQTTHYVYEVVPGMLAGGIFYIAAYLIKGNPPATDEQEPNVE